MFHLEAQDPPAEVKYANLKPIADRTAVRSRLPKVPSDLVVRIGEPLTANCEAFVFVPLVGHWVEVLNHPLDRTVASVVDVIADGPVLNAIPPVATIVQKIEKPETSA